MVVSNLVEKCKKSGKNEEFYQELLQEVFPLLLAGAGWQSQVSIQIFQVFFQLLRESELSFGASRGINADGRSQTLSEPSGFW